MIEQKPEKTVSLKILEAYTRDVGRGIIRIDYDSMDELKASTGSILEIEGKRKTLAKCLPLYPSDEGKVIARTDGLVRNNVDSKMGEVISVKKIKAFQAETVTVTALEDIPPIDERYLADALEGIPALKGDNVRVPYFGGRLDFQIIETVPSGPVVIQEKTLFKIIEDKEKFERYSKFGQAFLQKETALVNELEDLITKEYTDEIGDKILSINQKIEKNKTVRKIANDIFKHMPKEKFKEADDVEKKDMPEEKKE